MLAAGGRLSNPPRTVTNAPSERSQMSVVLRSVCVMCVVCSTAELAASSSLFQGQQPKARAQPDDQKRSRATRWCTQSAVELAVGKKGLVVVPICRGVGVHPFHN